jgi:hypothetical protein
MKSKSKKAIKIRIMITIRIWKRMGAGLIGQNRTLSYSFGVLISVC